MNKYTGWCLCWNIKYEIEWIPKSPHFCSCHMCQKWSWAPIVAWVNFLRKWIKFNWPWWEPKLYRSSDFSQRGFCDKCWWTIYALDDNSKNICITISTIDNNDYIIPKTHSFSESASSWLKINNI